MKFIVEPIISKLRFTFDIRGLIPKRNSYGLIVDFSKEFGSNFESIVFTRTFNLNDLTAIFHVLMIFDRHSVRYSNVFKSIFNFSLIVIALQFSIIS